MSALHLLASGLDDSSRLATAAGPGIHPTGVVFGKPLKDSLAYANVQISTANANGELYVWGYIPVVVAKWCVPPTPCPIEALTLIALYAVACISRRTVRHPWRCRWPDVVT